MAIVEDGTNTYQVFQDLTPSAPSAETEAGTGGDDIPELSADRRTFLDSLAQAAVENGSSYTLPAGVVDRDAYPYDHRWTAGENLHERSEDAELGEGGTELGLFSVSRTQFLETVGGVPVTNNSSYRMPEAVVDNSAYPFDHRWYDGENILGVGVSGYTADGEGEPLSGEAVIYDENTEYVRESVSSQFVVRGPAPNGIEDGSNTAGTSVSFDFDPTRPGVTFRREGIGSGLRDLAIEYGTVQGTITDFNGDPVPNESVKALGAGSSTDMNGEYKFLAPGGEDVDFISLAGYTTKTVTPSARTTLNVDWQFSGVKASIRLPDGTNIPNAPVEISTPEGERRTDEGGEYQYIRVPPETEVEVGYLGVYTRTFTTGAEGQNTEAAMELGAGCKGTVISERANVVGDVDILMDVEGVPVSFTREDGNFALGVLEPGDIKVVCAKDDRRYQRADEDLHLEEGDVVDLTFELEDATIIGKAV